MGFFGNKEKTSEEKLTDELVDELVGTGILVKGKVKDDAFFVDHSNIQKEIKKIWKKGASKEEIQILYNKLTNQDKKLNSNEINKMKEEFLVLSSQLRIFNNKTLINNSTLFTYCILEENRIIIRVFDEKRSKFIEEIEITYNNIFSIDYKYPSIKIKQKDKISYVLVNKDNNNDENYFKNFHETLQKKVELKKFKLKTENNETADNLAKWFDLKEKGVITKEEYEIKKKELL